MNENNENINNQADEPVKQPETYSVLFTEADKNSILQFVVSMQSKIQTFYYSLLQKHCRKNGLEIEAILKQVENLGKLLPPDQAAMQLEDMIQKLIEEYATPDDKNQLKRNNYLLNGGMVTLKKLNNEPLSKSEETLWKNFTNMIKEQSEKKGETVGEVLSEQV